MITKQPVLWATLKRHVPQDTWTPIRDLYAVIERHVALTKSDQEHTTSESKDPRWRRNVRNILLYRTRTGAVLWDKNANYLFPSGATPAAAQDDDEVASVVSSAVRPRGGQSFSKDPLLRRAVELRAMEVARIAAEADGWTVEDVSASRPFDLLCRRGNLQLDLEVKGTTSDGDRVFLTANEVAHARAVAPAVALAIVSKIRIVARDPPQVEGGSLRIISPWTVDEGTLTPLAFEYDVPE